MSIKIYENINNFTGFLKKLSELQISAIYAYRIFELRINGDKKE